MKELKTAVKESALSVMLEIANGRKTNKLINGFEQRCNGRPGGVQSSPREITYAHET